MHRRPGVKLPRPMAAGGGISVVWVAPAVVPMGAAAAKVSPAPTSKQWSLEKVFCSWGGPVPDHLMTIASSQALAGYRVRPRRGRSGREHALPAIDVRRWAARAAERRRERDSGR